MADEAYRAVFLRVHPTGKMVLSLTTDSDGKEGEYAQLVGAELGVPALDVKVVAADTDRFGEGHGFNTSPSAGTAAAIASATAKIRDKGRLLAGMALDADPGGPHVVRTAPGWRATAATPSGPRPWRTWPSTRTAPARCPRAWRAASMRRPSTAIER